MTDTIECTIKGLPEFPEVEGYVFGGVMWGVPIDGDYVVSHHYDRWTMASGNLERGYLIAILRKVEPEVFYGKIDPDYDFPTYPLPNGDRTRAAGLPAHAARCGWKFIGFGDESFKCRLDTTNWAGSPMYWDAESCEQKNYPLAKFVKR